MANGKMRCNVKRTSSHVSRGDQHAAPWSTAPCGVRLKLDFSRIHMLAELLPLPHPSSLTHSQTSAAALPPWMSSRKILSWALLLNYLPKTHGDYPQGVFTMPIQWFQRNGEKLGVHYGRMWWRWKVMGKESFFSTHWESMMGLYKLNWSKTWTREKDLFI